MEKWERTCLSRYLSFETTMSLASGTRLGAYEIVSLLGAGGMGEVYKARDGRLERTVAVKTLPPRVAADPNLKQRFEREAKALATLSHPHICSVFDVGPATTEQGAIDFLVIQYLEGETLAQRLARGALPSSGTRREHAAAEPTQSAIVARWNPSPCDLGRASRVELSVFRLDGRPPLPLAQSAGIQGAI
jgi:Protein kinase domain